MPLTLQHTTLTQFLIEERRRYPEASGDFNSVILCGALACKSISRAVAFGALGGVLGNAAAPGGAGGSINVQGEVQKTLDVMSNDAFLRINEWGGHLAGMASEEMDEPYQIPGHYSKGKYLLVFVPLDGSSNIDVNVSEGSIFSVLRAPEGSESVAEKDFLLCGVVLVAVGFVFFGFSSLLVL